MECQKLLRDFDEIVRCSSVLFDGNNVENSFISALMYQLEMLSKLSEASEECGRLRVKLNAAEKDISVLDNKLATARRWLEKEQNVRRLAEADRDSMACHLNEVRKVILLDPRLKISDEAKEKLSFLDKASGDAWNIKRQVVSDRLITIGETDSVSEFSFSRSGDELEDIPIKKRRSTQLSHQGIISPSNMRTPEAAEKPPIPSVSTINRINTRQHAFVNKLFYMPESCSGCTKKIGFRKVVWRCTDCQMNAHPECRDKIPVPCVPIGSSPRKGGTTISDFSPASSPMIPAIVINCIKEVEERGLKEVGIYRLSGSESVVRSLREKFVKGKGVNALCLNTVDIHSVCCFLKDFLRNLQDPLIPRTKWNMFAYAIADDRKDEKLHEIIVTLPQANRDTLAFLILHLQIVATSPECRMPVSSLATVFGPTVVGFSTSEPMGALGDMHTANSIMEELLSLPGDYWNNFINSETNSVSPNKRKLRTPALKRDCRVEQTPVTGGKRKYFRNSPL